MGGRPDHRSAGGCVSANGASGGTGGRCLDGNDGLGATYTLAISPDGRSVYAAGVNGVTSFARDGTTGNLVQTGCNGPVNGCAPVAAGVSSVFDLAVTPDGGEVIAGAHGSESVISFHRDPATGALATRAGTRGCLTRTGNAGLCLTLPLLDDDHHVRLAMDPTGLRFYVASRAGMLATITRDFTPKCQSAAVDTAFNTLVAIPLACADANGDRFTVEKVGLPAAGQLGEIVNNDSVFYSPFANFTGSDSFTIRAKSPDRGSTARRRRST